MSLNELEFKFDKTRLDEYSSIINEWCLVNGLIFLTKQSSEKEKNKVNFLGSSLPVTLFPTRFPAKQFEFALKIQNNFNSLVHQISNDYEFLKETLKKVILVDDFTCRLWNIYEKVRNEGIAQPISLSILRNDYMLDMNKKDKEIKLSQVEINTISCSFGAATTLIPNLHKYVLNYTDNRNFYDKQVFIDNLTVLAKGLIEAWKLYNNPNAQVVFIVSADERNIGDQRKLEYKCFELEPSIKIVRHSLSYIFLNGKLDQQKRFIINGTNEIGLVYFRAGYAPHDYSSENEWEARLLIERSKAIKSPSIQMHLTGAKRIQQELCKPNIVENFVEDKTSAFEIRSTFVDQYSFDENNIDELVDLIEKNSQNFVLKPQREGGGNNIYREAIKDFVKTLKDKSDLMGYILMQLIKPQVGQNYSVKNDSAIKLENMISELGVFGVLISNSNSIIKNETGGYLLRTKACDVDEGGVATGFSALDSIYLG